jgi:hypothetical protein
MPSPIYTPIRKNSDILGLIRSLMGLPLGIVSGWLGLHILTSYTLAESSPEYLKAQNATEVDLEDSHSATESVGLLPKNSGNQYDPVVNLEKVPRKTLEEKARPSSPFIDDLEWAIHPRFYYFHRNIKGLGIQESAALGGSLGFETGWFKDTIRFGLTGYTSQKIYGPSDRDGAGLLKKGQHGYSALGEAYIDLKLRKTSLRAGRTRVNLPYINGNDFRMTPNTFEAIGLRSESIKKFKWGIGHFGGIKGNTDTQFKTMSEAAGVEGTDRDVSVISMRYEFSEQDFIALSKLYGWDMYNTLYVEGEKFFEYKDQFKILLGAQYTNQRSVGDELLGDFNTQTAGIKASFQYCNVIASLAYTWTGMSREPLKPWGSTPGYNSMIIQDFDRAGEQSFHIGLTYDFEPHGIEGLSLDTSWTTGNTPDHGKYASLDQQEFDCTLDYQPPAEALDGLWIRFRYADNRLDGGDGMTDFRVIANYSYMF